MDNKRPAKIITRDEIRDAFERSRKPGLDLLAGAAGGLLVQWLEGWFSVEAGNLMPAVKAAVSGALILWVLRFFRNVWMAPRHIAIRDREDLAVAYEKRVARADAAERRAAELEARLAEGRNDAYVAMSRLVEHIDRLKRSPTREVARSSPAVFDALDDLRPLVRDDEFLALALTHPTPDPRGYVPVSECYRALDGLREGLIQLMREYR